MNHDEKMVLPAGKALQDRLSVLSERAIECVQSKTSAEIPKDYPRVRFAFDIVSLHSPTADHLHKDTTFVSHWNETSQEWSYALNKDTLHAVVTAAETVEHVVGNCSESSMSARRLLLLAGPANYTRWGVLKACLTEQCALATSCSCLKQLVEEMFMTSLVLSKAHKLVDVWSHRLWLWCKILPLLSGLHYTNVLQWVWSQEASVFEDACHGHTMNLNAWQYRRQMMCLCSSNMLFPGMVKNMSNRGPLSADLLRTVLEHHEACTSAFLRTHHRDASCSRFLVDFLLSASQAVVLLTDEDVKELQFVVVNMWKRWMTLSSRLLAQTSSSGHESLWHLRLGLIVFALRWRSSELPGNWSVADEIEFVHAHTSIEVDCTDSSSAPLDFTVCSGSVNFHQWHAARYGIQLLTLLTSTISPSV